MHPTLVLLRQPRDAAASCELLEMLAALAVFALPLTVLALDAPHRLLATDDPQVQTLLEQLPGFGAVSLYATDTVTTSGFTPADGNTVRDLLTNAQRVIGA